MTVRSITKRPTPSRAISVTTAAPYKGLDTVDSLAAMDPHFCLSAQNWLATPQGLSMRQGYKKWVTGLPATPTSLLTYNSTLTSSSKLFAVAGSSIYDVTSAGTVGAAVVTGLSSTNTYWQSTTQTYSTSGTNYLVAVNGYNAPLLYNGSSWTTCTQTGSPSAPGQWKNVDANGNAVSISDFIDVVLHQQRLWFVAVNTTKAYYADVASLGGNLTPFDFGPLFPRGGSLFKLATWTIDLGSTSGTQSMLVAISSKGDVVVFQGNNPGSSTTWQLMGVYQLGSPVGRRCTAALQGDLMILSQDGLYPLSKYIQSGRVDSAASLTYTITPTISALVQAYATTPGFELLVAPTQNVLMLNVPQPLQTNNFQFVFHTITKGWTQFVDWPAQCFGIFNDNVYFGGPDFIGQAFQGYADGADSTGVGGSAITATALTAFSFMSDVPGLGSGILKHVKMVKPYIVTNVAGPVVKVGVNTDFNLSTTVGTATTTVPSGAVWGSALWDGAAATWASSQITYNQWATPVSLPGDALAFAVSVSAQGETLWTSTGWLIERGGQFG